MDDTEKQNANTAAATAATTAEENQAAAAKADTTTAAAAADVTATDATATPVEPNANDFPPPRRLGSKNRFLLHTYLVATFYILCAIVHLFILQIMGPLNNESSLCYVMLTLMTIALVIYLLYMTFDSLRLNPPINWLLSIVAMLAFIYATAMCTTSDKNACCILSTALLAYMLLIIYISLGYCIPRYTFSTFGFAVALLACYITILLLISIALHITLEREAYGLYLVRFVILILTFPMTLIMSQLLHGHYTKREVPRHEMPLFVLVILLQFLTLFVGLLFAPQLAEAALDVFY